MEKEYTIQMFCDIKNYIIIRKEKYSNDRNKKCK